MVWGRQTFGQQLVLITTPEETIFLAYGYVGGGVRGVCGGRSQIEGYVYVPRLCYFLL